MKIIKKVDCHQVEWESVAVLLKTAGLTPHSAEEYQKAFENSYKAIFLYSDSQLIGCGRMISDKSYQGAVYDVAVLPNFQGKGLGKEIMNYLLADSENLTLILYAAEGKTKFYEKLGFHMLERGMRRN